MDDRYILAFVLVVAAIAIVELIVEYIKKRRRSQVQPTSPVHSKPAAPMPVRLPPPPPPDVPIRMWINSLRNERVTFPLPVTGKSFAEAIRKGAREAGFFSSEMDRWKKACDAAERELKKVPTLVSWYCGSKFSAATEDGKFPKNAKEVESMWRAAMEKTEAYAVVLAKAQAEYAANPPPPIQVTEESMSRAIREYVLGPFERESLKIMRTNEIGMWMLEQLPTEPYDLRKYAVDRYLEHTERYALDTFEEVEALFPDIVKHAYRHLESSKKWTADYEDREYGAGERRLKCAKCGKRAGGGIFIEPIAADFLQEIDGNKYCLPCRMEAEKVALNIYQEPISRNIYEAERRKKPDDEL